jgi:hypothetical protein
MKHIALAAGALLATNVATLAAAQDAPAYHLYQPHKTFDHTPAKSKVLYYGGSVFSNVKTVAVLWNGGVAKTIASKVGGFTAALPNSTFLDQLAQYSTVGLTGVNGNAGTNQTLGRGTYLGLFTLVPKNTSTSLTDAQVQAEIAGQIAAGKLPAHDLNTLYMIYFPSNITISLGNAKSCVAFGAYHEAVSSTVTAGNIFYAVMPDCGGGLGGITVAASHEFAEATTDNIPTPGSHPAYPQAWNTAGGAEIGDLCESNTTTLKAGKITYQIQEVWSNTTGACATGKFTSP